MANMAYCRFQNTVKDMRDCVKNLDESDLSPEEEKAREKFLKMCREVAKENPDQESES